MWQVQFFLPNQMVKPPSVCSTGERFSVAVRGVPSTPGGLGDQRERQHGSVQELFC